MFESSFDAYLIFLYGGLRCADVPLPAWQVACHFVGPPIQTATIVPKKTDEKHELSRRRRDSGARIRAVLDTKWTIVTGHIL